MEDDRTPAEEIPDDSPRKSLLRRVTLGAGIFFTVLGLLGAVTVGIAAAGVGELDAAAAGAGQSGEAAQAVGDAFGLLFLYGLLVLGDIVTAVAAAIGIPCLLPIARGKRGIARESNAVTDGVAESVTDGVSASVTVGDKAVVAARVSLAVLLAAVLVAVIATVCAAV